MKSQLLTTIQQAFPGSDIIPIREGAYSWNIGIDEWFDVGCMGGRIYIHVAHKTIFDGPIPTENGQPDWDFIRKVLVNWRSF